MSGRPNQPYPYTNPRKRPDGYIDNDGVPRQPRDSSKKKEKGHQHAPGQHPHPGQQLGQPAAASASGQLNAPVAQGQPIDPRLRSEVYDSIEKIVSAGGTLDEAVNMHQIAVRVQSYMHGLMLDGHIYTKEEVIEAWKGYYERDIQLAIQQGRDTVNIFPTPWPQEAFQLRDIAQKALDAERRRQGKPTRADSWSKMEATAMERKPSYNDPNMGMFGGNAPPMTWEDQKLQVWKDRLAAFGPVWAEQKAASEKRWYETSSRGN